MATREDIVGFLTRYTGIPVENLTDEAILDPRVTVAFMEPLVVKFGVSVVIRNPQHFTVGDLVKQLIE